MARFTDLTIIVTGATGGFGKRAAERFAAEGANLVLSDIHDDPGKAFSGIPENQYVYQSGNIADENTSIRLVELAGKQFGGLDIAFNNAGIAQDFTPLPRIESALAQRIIDVDLMGVFYAMKHQIPAMLEHVRSTGRSCSILNTSSLAGVAGAPQLSIYAAAKHGVVGLTRSAAAEYARKGIRVNALCPAFARTEMVVGGLRDTEKSMEEGIAQIVRGVPMRRLGEVDEIMEAVLFACDPANGFMTGQTLTIDGGVSAV